MLKQIARDISRILYPAKCIKCGCYMDEGPDQSSGFESCFCDSCMKTGYFPISSPYCSLCGLQLPRTTGDTDNHLCQTCLKTPLKLGKIRAAGQYRGVLKDAVHLFKYHSKLSVANTLEQLLFNAFEKHFAALPIDMIMPVPLHKKRTRERGFNQAYVLVRRFREFYVKQNSCEPDWQINTTALVRKRRTAPQTGFDISRRKSNLKGAFRVAGSAGIENRHILLIDDVLTTGTTCNEAAKELFRNGAARVDALVLVRA